MYNTYPMWMGSQIKRTLYDKFNMGEKMMNKMTLALYLLVIHESTGCQYVK